MSNVDSIKAKIKYIFSTPFVIKKIQSLVFALSFRNSFL